MYYKNIDKADKGHLNPVKINSFDQNHAKATFTYSNAVPQYLGWNRGQWQSFEGRIVNHVRTKCAANGGTMYLMTGTSKFRLQIGAATPTQDPKVTVSRHGCRLESYVNLIMYIVSSRRNERFRKLLERIYRYMHHND